MHFKKKKGAKHLTGVEIEAVVPNEAEVRLLGNRHRQCLYYQIGKYYCWLFNNSHLFFFLGVDVCHTQMLKDKADNFLACKQPLDGMWRCYTEEKYGQSIRDAPDYSKKYEAKFYNCLFREGTGMDLCMPHFSDMVRSIHRSGESTLNDKNWMQIQSII